MGELFLECSKQEMNIEENTPIHKPFIELPTDVRPNRSTKREINILLIGTTGTGRSTIINALANYPVYATLEQAMNGSMQVLIPFSFCHTEMKTGEEKQIVYFEDDDYEQIEGHGDTCTNKSRSFVFTIDDRLLRFIDTPPVGEDTRGFEQDIENIGEIMKSISRYEYLDGICIVLKPNEERLHVSFRYYLSEMLGHLPRTAVENLMFIFTNARHTFFAPGGTRGILQQLFDGYQREHNVQLLIEKENTFFMDNEGFRCLALHRRGIRLSEEEIAGCMNSWNRTTQEYVRLFAYVIDRPIHHVHETISLYRVQRLITVLTDALFKVCKHLERGIQQPEEYMTIMSKHPELLSQYAVQIRSLNLPRLVCTSPKCLGMMYVNGSPKMEYKSVCYLGSNFTGNAIENKSNVNIRACTIMDQKTGTIYRILLLLKNQFIRALHVSRNRLSTVLSRVHVTIEILTLLK